MDKEYISHGLGFTEQPYHFVIKKNGDVQRACILFNQAKQCYAKWGSNMKVESITQ